ncbi:MAG TPA: hypothetical protein VFY96_07915 [Candidatus Binatia bacterium]|nr:hypothetical protein [Candidatus Binatia bacterium]
MSYLNATFEAFQVPQDERDEVVAFVGSTTGIVTQTGEAILRDRPSK